MAATKTRALTRQDYAEAVTEYASRLTLENQREATPQATQREITLASLALVKARRPDVQVFNELLVQYPKSGSDKPGQVVPDNMVVVSQQPCRAESSFDLPLEQAAPFWVLEYVSPNSKRKDYVDNMVKYEHDLKVPYYLRFDPQQQELALLHHNKRKYVQVKPNAQGRLAVAELDMEVALLDGWVRFWHLGELLPLPADLQRDLDAVRRQLAEERRARLAAEEEVARLRAQLALAQRSKRNGS